MTVTVAIWGAEGNMGRRYRAVCNALSYRVIPIDVTRCSDDTINLQESFKADCVLVATPTYTHEAVLDKLLLIGKPVLCEKPLIKDVERTKIMVGRYKAAGVPLRMVNQYSYMLGPMTGGPSYYNYWNHGKDGLAWDCINILGLATASTVLKEDSYFWDVAINGERLTQGMVDHSYFDMLKDWPKKFAKPMSDYIIHATEKAADYEAKQCVKS